MLMPVYYPCRTARLVSYLIKPANYKALLDLKQTELGIKQIKEFFQQNLSSELRLRPRAGSGQPAGPPAAGVRRGAFPPRTGKAGAGRRHQSGSAGAGRDGRPRRALGAGSVPGKKDSTG